MEWILKLLMQVALNLVFEVPYVVVEVVSHSGINSINTAFDDFSQEFLII